MKKPWKSTKNSFLDSHYIHKSIRFLDVCKNGLEKVRTTRTFTCFHRIAIEHCVVAAMCKHSMGLMDSVGKG